MEVSFILPKFRIWGILVASFLIYLTLLERMKRVERADFSLLAITNVYRGWQIEFWGKTRKVGADRILSRRDLVDGSKDSKNYPRLFGKNIFFIFRPKKFENGKKQSKNDQK